MAKKNKTLIQFDLARLGDKHYCSDPNSLYVFGFINFYLLEEFLTDAEYLNYMVEGMKLGESRTVTMKVWEDSDDFRTWLDYEMMPDDYEIPIFE